MTSIFLASVLFLFLLPNSRAVYHCYIADKKDETIWHECSFLSLNNWQPGWQHCPPNVQCELWDKKRIDWDFTRFKAGSESKAFLIDKASAGFGLFSKTVSKLLPNNPESFEFISKVVSCNNLTVRKQKKTNTTFVIGLMYLEEFFFNLKYFFLVHINISEEANIFLCILTKIA